MNMKILVLVPTLNSQDYLLDTISDLEAHIPEADILVIDYGSEDRTKNLIANNSVNHLIMPLKSTYYVALSLGMKFAFQNNYDIVIEWDDKGKFEAKDIRYFTKTLERNNIDFVLGSRFIAKSPPRKFRWSGTRMLRRMIRFTVRKKVSDPTLRFRAYGSKAIETFARVESFEPAPDTIFKLIKEGYTFAESQTSLTKGNDRQLHNSRINSIGEIFRWSMWILFVLPFSKKIKIEKESE